jgi:hypothetical protein
MAANWSGSWLGKWAGKWLGPLGAFVPPVIVAYFRIVAQATERIFLDGQTSTVVHCASVADMGLALATGAGAVLYLQCPPERGAGW